MMRPLIIILALTAFVAAPVLAPVEAFAQQEPPAQATPQLPQSTSPEADPDEASPQGPDENQPDAPPVATPGNGISYSAIRDNASLEGRIKASAAAAQGLQGPLDGGWTVRTGDGEALYGLQISDRPSGSLEGAWRDMRRTGAMNARGVIATLVRTGSELQARFYPRDGGDPVVLQLTGYSDDVWAGSLWEPGGVETAVSVTRNEPRPVVDYAAGGWTTRPAGERIIRARPAAHEYAKPCKKGRRGKAECAAKGGKGKGKAAKPARGKGGSKASKPSKGGKGKAAPKGGKKKKR